MTELRDQFPAFDAFKIAFDSQSLALFLDVDGTLLQIASRPDAVHVTPLLRELLDALLALNTGALALVSGRRLADVDRLFAPLQLPVAGLHGLERRDSFGIIHSLDRSADLGEVRRFLSAQSYSDVLIEDKGSALVLHYREAPARELHCRELALAAAARMNGGWQVVPGKMSFEIRVAGLGKQDAIRSFMAEPPFLGRQA
ncbi:MAG: trehalose-phosphatase, partial [Pseudomonadota bacterium]